MECMLKLSFEANTDHILKKANQRLYLLRKLRSFSVSQEILETVYRSLIESVLVFNCIVWFGNLSVKNKTRLTRVVNMAGKIIGLGQYSLEDLYISAVRRKSLSIVSDPTHPLSDQFQLLPSGRRYRMPFAKKNAFKKSFIPTAVSILNATKL